MGKTIMKSVLLATPCYNGGVHMAYMQSVLRTVMQAPSRGYDIHVFQNTDSLVTRARNNAVATFLDGSWDYLFWVDSDIGFDPSQFFKLLDLDRGVTAGGYPLKTYYFPVEPINLVGRDLEASMLRYALNLQGDITTVPDDGFVEVQDAATGFMCIKRRVLEEMVETYPELKYRSDQELLGGPTSLNHYLFFDTMIENGRYLSEDYAFCRRAQNLGHKIWMDMRSELTHVGQHEFKGSIPDTNRAAQLTVVPE